MLRGFSGHDFSVPVRFCKRIFILLLILATTAETNANASVAEEALRNACEYLWNQQEDDGGWHSKQYSMLRSGQALTPFVLHALLQVPESVCPRPEGGVARALDFIRRHIDEYGAVGHTDPDIVEYPVYSTAYALQCLTAIRYDAALASAADTKLRSDMYCFLSDAQYDEADGFATTDAAYGGWGFDAAKKDGEPGHMDLAHTRRALEALRCYVPEKAWPAFTRAKLFLRVVQKDKGRLAEPRLVGQFLHYPVDIPFDGGFYFSPVVEEANKGRFSSTFDGKAAPHFRSYATATCDGVLALLAAGVSRDDSRVVAAIEWLRAHDDFTYPQGIPIDHPEPWGDAVCFYHHAVRAEVYAALDWPGDWRPRLAAFVSRSQSAEGGFRNSASPLMKEDDPLLCTALAVVALSRCLEE